LAIATYDRPYNLKDRRESLSLDQGPAEEIIGAKGLVKAGLMAPTGGSSSEPEEPFVGKQPEFEGLSEKEEAASWELEKLAYKSKLEKLSGIVDDMDEDIEESRPLKKKQKEFDYSIEERVASILDDTKKDKSIFPDDTARLKNFLTQVDPTKQGSRKRSLDVLAENELYSRYLAIAAPRTGTKEEADYNKLRDGIANLTTMEQMSADPEVNTPEAGIPEGRGINMRVPKADPDATDPRKGVYGDFRGPQRNEGLKQSLVETRDENFLSKKQRITMKAASAVSHSNFNDPIVKDGLRGNSRLAHDADADVQGKVIDLIVQEAKEQGMSAKETAMVLAIAHAESGFNPDAANETSSAAGVGQFLTSTGEAYGLTNENKWDVNAQVKALVTHTKDNYEYIRKNNKPLSWVYKLHHDGLGSANNAKNAGIRKSIKNVLSVYNAIVGMIMKKTGFGLHAATSEDKSDLTPTKSIVPKRRP